MISDAGSEDGKGKILGNLIKSAPFRRLKNIRLIYRLRIDSTQSYIAKVLKSEKEGDLVISGIQTAGIGRKGTAWISQHGGLWMTITLIPKEDKILAEIPLKVGATSILKTLADFDLKDCRIKPPNDVYSKDGKKKIAGVLADSIIQAAKPPVVYLGIGVNVNNNPSEENSIGGIATSLSKELGKEVDLEAFTVALLKHLDLEYDHLDQRRVD